MLTMKDFKRGDRVVLKEYTGDSFKCVIIAIDEHHVTLRKEDKKLWSMKRDDFLWRVRYGAGEK